MAQVFELFREECYVEAVDTETFEHVHRATCKGTMNESYVTMDFNYALFPLKARELFRLVVYKEEVIEKMSVTELVGAELKSCVMYGTVYRFEDKGGSRTLYVSFGGLLLKLKANEVALSKFEADANVYLLASTR